MRRKTIGFIGMLSSIMILTAGCGSVSNYKYNAKNVENVLEEAEQLFADGKYEESLEKYLDAMEAEPKDEVARIGVIKSQIELENYDIALTDIGMLLQINPYNEDAYLQYLEMGKRKDDMQILRTVVRQAKKYNIAAIMDIIPSAPTVSVEEGNYNEPIYLELSCDEADGEIYYDLINSEIYGGYNNTYANAIPVLGGKTVLSAYVVKDGIPSMDLESEYIVEYDGTVISFEDKLVEKTVALSIDKEVGTITDLDCWKLTSFDSGKLREDGMSYDDYKELNILSLNDLKYMPNLQSLDLEYQERIADYSPLKYCNRLSSLYVQYCELTNLDVLKYTPELTYLNAYDNKLSDFSGLEYAKNITDISIYNQDADIVKIDNYIREKDFRRINFDVYQIDDYSILEGMDNLTEIYIYNYSDEYKAVLGTIEKKEKLTRLTLQSGYDSNHNRNAISDLSFAKNLSELTYLYLYGLNDSAQLDNLYGLSNLQYLYLYNSEVTKDEEVMNQLIKALPNCDIRY